MIDPDPSAPIDSAVARMDRLDRALRRQFVVVVIFGAALIVSATGWWLTSRDHAATERNGRVADCRSAELATTLDAFTIIVSPRATPAEKDAAAGAVGDLPSLLDRYEECIATG